MLKTFFTSLLLLLLSSELCLSSEVIKAYVPEAETVGEGRLRVFFRDVYDARLVAPQGKLDTEQPFALELSYLMNVKGKKIAEYSIKQIKRQGEYDESQLQSWSETLKELFPDVAKGQRLTGIYTASGQSVFLTDDRVLGEVEDPKLSKAFFDIWISEQTSAPKLRKKLLGEQ